MKPVNRDRLFFKGRDAEFAEAKKALEGANIDWRHSSLDRTGYFFAAARTRRGSELLAKICVKMGVDWPDLEP